MPTAIAAKKKPPITADPSERFKYFQVLRPLLDRWHGCGTQQDRAGNRKLFFDHFGSWLLLYFFNPILTSWRGSPQASGLDKVRKILGSPRASLGSWSEARRVFDPKVLREIIQEFAAKAQPFAVGKEAQARKDLTAVEGTLWPALPKMAWALWLENKHRAAKMHLHFDVLKGGPCDATITEANASENGQLRETLQPRRLYGMDHGYAEYQLFQDIIDQGSSFIGRVKKDAVWNLPKERPLTPQAKAAGVCLDLSVDLGCPQSDACFKQKLRVVKVDTGKTDSRGEPETLLVAPKCLDLDAQTLALGYRFRWSVELYFRWFQCLLGCKDLLFQSQNGVRIEVSIAWIASLLISWWTGQKPTKRTFERIELFLSGFASAEERMNPINKQHDHQESHPKSPSPAVGGAFAAAHGETGYRKPGTSGCIENQLTVPAVRLKLYTILIISIEGNN